MLTKIKRDPSDPFLRPDYVRFHWKQGRYYDVGNGVCHRFVQNIPKPPKLRRNYDDIDLLNLEEKLKVKFRRKFKR
jgi:hypothetical protein